MIRPAAGWLAAVLVWILAIGQAAGGHAEAGRGAASCGFADGRPAAGRLLPEGRAWLYRFDPAPLQVGRPFAVDLLACTDDPRDLVGLDAVMPAHRHGMNYRPKLRALAPGTWRAEGLLLHMPGDWRFDFRFRGASGPAEAQATLTLR